ncbi:MAG: hypothetical protein UZ18_ATM001000950 [Armatimonadetes bacterium OLB18]|nr:MAG: hypothetical protein UZ18_ATM001000950 [Armatimonadetes bacterium OLB18]
MTYPYVNSRTRLAAANVGTVIAPVEKADSIVAPRKGPISGGGAKNMRIAWATKQVAAPYSPTTHHFGSSFRLRDHDTKKALRVRLIT